MAEKAFNALDLRLLRNLTQKCISAAHSKIVVNNNEPRVISVMARSQVKWFQNQYMISSKIYGVAWVKLNILISIREVLWLKNKLNCSSEKPAFKYLAFFWSDSMDF